MRAVESSSLKKNWSLVLVINPFSFGFHVAGELATRLQEASVKIISRNMCNKLYDDAVTPRMLCAGNLQGGVDACQVSVSIKAEF